MTVYRAITHDAGERTEFDTGGYYEQTENGIAQIATIGGEYVGWKSSDTRQICASKTPHAATLAKAQAIDEVEFPITVYVYEITETPHEDLTKTSNGDFALLEEVRFNNPTDNPITPIEATQFETITVPQQAATDIQLIYLMDNGSIIYQWGEAVKTGFKHLIETGTYPNITELTSVERPNEETYKNPYDHAEPI